MTGSRLMHWILCCLVAAVGVAGCSTDTTSSETSGSLSLNLEVGSVDIDEVDYLITGNGTVEGGAIDTSAPGSTASVEVFGLLPGDYTVTLSATATDGVTMCEGSEDFSVDADALTEVMVLGMVAVRAGQGRKIYYDGPNMRITNDEAANKFLTREYRSGFGM